MEAAKRVLQIQQQNVQQEVLDDDVEQQPLSARYVSQEELARVAAQRFSALSDRESLNFLQPHYKEQILVQGRIEEAPSLGTVKLARRLEQRVQDT